MADDAAQPPRSQPNLVGRGKRLARLFAAMQQNDPAMVMALLMTVETLDNRPENTLTDTMQEALRDTTDPFLVYRKLAGSSRITNLSRC